LITETRASTMETILDQAVLLPGDVGDRQV
jgi:hypothetical protein